MSYQIRYTDQINNSPLVVDDNTTNQTTSLQFPGRNTTGYGQAIGENFLHLLENFANTTEPIRPVKGQLWYDSNVSIKQLKVYDGTQWVAAGGLKKGNSEPLASYSIPGDLWVNTDTQQLFLFTGSSWILIGPKFSAGARTGAEPESIIDTLNNTQTVISNFVDGERVAIFSKVEFIPKSAISGFPTVYAGTTLNANYNLYYGKAEVAKGLLVGTSTVAANNFLRGDIISNTYKGLNVKNNADGLQIGEDSQLQLYVDGGKGVIFQKTSGSSLDFRVNNNGSQKVVIRVDSQERVGINNQTPSESLDVVGNIRVAPESSLPDTTGTLTVAGIVNSTSTQTGALVVQGGAGIAKSLYVGADSNIAGTLTIGTGILPDNDQGATLGERNRNFSNVFSKVFGDPADYSVSTFYGTFDGTLRGNATGSSTKLASSTIFEMTGDVTSNELEFDGATGSIPATTTSASGNGSLVTLTFAAAWSSSTTYPLNRYVTYSGSTYLAIAQSGNLNKVPSSSSTYWKLVEVAPFPAGSIVVVSNITPTQYRGTYTVVTGTTTYITYTSTATGNQVIAGTISPAGVSGNRKQFITTLSEYFVTGKPEITDVANFNEGDEFLISQGAEGLKKIKKSTMWQAISQTPIGAVMPFAGLTAPTGWLLCDGAEVRRVDYPGLFAIIGYTYGNPSIPYDAVTNPNGLKGYDTFRLPDLRGRFALGADNMNNNIEVPSRTNVATSITTIGASADRVTDPRADIDTSVEATSTSVEERIGAGDEAATLTVNNLPDHEHDLKGSSGGRYGAYSDQILTDPGVVPVKGLGGEDAAGSLWRTSGGILTEPEGGPFSQPVNLMNPFLAMQFIIYTGKDI